MLSLRRTGEGKKHVSALLDLFSSVCFSRLPGVLYQSWRKRLTLPDLFGYTRRLTGFVDEVTSVDGELSLCKFIFFAKSLSLTNTTDDDDGDNKMPPSLPTYFIPSPSLPHTANASNHHHCHRPRIPSLPSM